MIDTYKVYVQTDSNSHITAVNSSAFLANPTGWMQIDEGTGDKYHHAQGNYLDGGLTTPEGVYRYKLKDGKAFLRDDLDAAIAAIKAAEDKQKQITDLKEKLTETDYAVIKIAEGAATKEEYAKIIASRAAWRAEINALQEGPA